MKLTTKITKRDVVLIYLLAIGLLIFGFVKYFYIPDAELKADLEFNMTDVMEQVMDMQTSIATLPAVKRDYDDAKASRDAITAMLYPVMRNFELDKMVTELFLSYGLTTQSFSVSSAAKNAAFSPYFASTLALTVKSGDKAATPADIYTAEVAVKASGSYDDVMRLIDDLSAEYESMRVTSYTLGTQAVSVGVTDSGSPIMENRTSLAINLAIYMRAPEA